MNDTSMTMRSTPPPPRARGPAQVPRLEEAGVLLDERDPRIVAEAGIDLAESTSTAIDAGRSALEEAIREAARRGADVEAGSPAAST